MMAATRKFTSANTSSANPTKVNSAASTAVANVIMLRQTPSHAFRKDASYWDCPCFVPALRARK